MVLLIDNYDSFSYNLVQFVGTITEDIRVIRNDAMTASEIRDLAPTHIILSPGPGYPCDAGVCEDVVRELAGSVPILGVCLGHQAICEVSGATISHAKKLMHGKQSEVEIDSEVRIFHSLPKNIRVARYHSLVADDSTIPDSLTVIARDTENHEVMAVKRADAEVYGVQFHPESILTPEGMTIIRNFLAI